MAKNKMHVFCNKNGQGITRNQDHTSNKICNAASGRWLTASYNRRGRRFPVCTKIQGCWSGPKALIAELIGGELARAAGLLIPEIVFAELDPAYGRSEPDEEIQDLLKASAGLNLALHFLSGSITYDPVSYTIDPVLVSRIVWLDAFLMNVDRTVRNTNMLVWHNELWLIDHGASLYFHHSWDNWEEQSIKPFVQIKDHVLLPVAKHMKEADIYMRSRITKEIISNIISIIPTNWLNVQEDPMIYEKFLCKRLDNADIFVTEVINAGKNGI